MSSGFYGRAVKPPRPFIADALALQLRQADRERVRALGDALTAYLEANLPVAIRRRRTLVDYRTNPYVLMTTAGTMRLDDPRDFANFLVNLKLYMGLETSFGKSIESIVLPAYPVGAPAENRWAEPAEKVAEFAELTGLAREQRARARNLSLWREVDRACVVNGRRHLLTVKSGPWTINDTQVEAMKDAIAAHSQAWLQISVDAYGVEGIDIVIGLTYGTERTTNNKENLILVKLLDSGFHLLEGTEEPILVNEAGTVRVYSRIGAQFWSYVGSPADPRNATFVFIEVLLALTMALKRVSQARPVEDALNDRLDLLADAIRGLRFPRGALPDWIREEFTETELTWLAAAMTAFFDAGLPAQDAIPFEAPEG